MDECKIGLGYNVVPPPYSGNFMPPKPDLVYPSLDDFVDVNKSICESIVENPTDASNEPKNASKENEATIIKDWVSERSRPNWIFDIDALTKSMNYKPVVAGNQSNGSVGTKSCDNVDSLGSGFKPSGEEEKKDAEDPGHCDVQMDVKSGFLYRKIEEECKKQTVVANSTTKAGEGCLEWNGKAAQDKIENSLITQEASGSLEDLEIIQEEDTHPSIDTSVNHEVNDLEIDEPQNDIIPIRRSIRTRHAPDHMCLYIDADEHELRDLGEPANYKAALLDYDKWLFKKKTGIDGVVHTYKARLVAKGYTHYEETFSLVVDIRAIRILISIAVFYDYEIWQMDVKTAFLNGYLFEKVYMKQHEGASTPTELKCMQNVPYASAVGFIMYFVRCTHPDVAFAQNLTSPFPQNPGDIKQELKVSCYTDAGYLTDVDDLKSQTRYVFVLNGGVVDWKSAKQSIFATSSVEAKYIAAYDAFKEAVWVRNFIFRLGVVLIIEDPKNMYCDNTRAITIANESRITKDCSEALCKAMDVRSREGVGSKNVQKGGMDGVIKQYGNCVSLNKMVKGLVGMWPCRGLRPKRWGLGVLEKEGEIRETVDSLTRIQHEPRINLSHGLTSWIVLLYRPILDQGKDLELNIPTRIMTQAKEEDVTHTLKVIDEVDVKDVAGAIRKTKYGNFVTKCPERNQNHEVNLNETQEKGVYHEEGTFFMMNHIEETIFRNEENYTPPKSESNANDEDDVWYFDIDASNHITAQLKVGKEVTNEMGRESGTCTILCNDIEENVTNIEEEANPHSSSVIVHETSIKNKEYNSRSDDTPNPLVRLDTIRLLIALAAGKGWKTHHLNVKLDFINGDRKKLDSTLKEIDLINEFRKRMASQFEILDLGELTYYLGINISQGKDCIEIKQERYALKILIEAGMEDCNPFLCPTEPRLKLSKAKDKPKVKATQYQKW
uniref:Reverse transcriptase Ty1/copia-type domain-containing protein n=1 Tax=Tanacetum cinerariifolium TaxID=118510 RepID=A0A699GIT5_TANCI|nr:hypothetical protein [Tanacetum cinerariifolium]